MASRLSLNLSEIPTSLNHRRHQTRQTVAQQWVPLLLMKRYRCFSTLGGLVEASRPTAITAILEYIRGRR